MSRSVVATAYGGPDVLAVVERDPGEPGPGEVLLDLKASAVNAIDWKGYSGLMGTDPARLPMPLGVEGAGVVAAVGPDVDAVRVGDEVIGFGLTGAYADRIVTPASHLLPKPAGLPWEQASGLLLTGVTATHLLEATGVHEGDVVLVHGGAGGVGRLVVQLARLRGSRVIATASAANQQRLRDLGAVPVVYGSGLLDRIRAATAETGPVTVALDTVGTDEALDTSVELVTDRSRVATIAGFARAGELQILLLGNGPGADPGTPIRAAARPRLVQLAADGLLDVAVASTYPLEHAAQAHRDSRAGHADGKLVLLP